MKTQEKTHYEVLGTHQDASREEIRRAYLKAVRASHPDVNPDADTDVFIAVSTAYEVLYDESARASYDRTLTGQPEPEPSTTGSGPKTPRAEDRTNRSPKAETGPKPATGGVRTPHIPKRTHVFGDVQSAPDSPTPRRILLGIGLALGPLALWLAWANPGETGAEGVFARLLHIHILTQLAFFVMAGSWALTALSAAFHSAGRHTAMTIAGMSGVGLAAAAMRDGVTWQYWVAVSLVAVAQTALIGAYFIPSPNGSFHSGQDLNTEILTHQVFGEPGSSLSESGLDAGRVEAGLSGEKRTAEHLWKLTGFDGLRIFHSMRFNPLEHTKGDIDHVLMYGQNIILLDSKVWTPGTYSFDTDDSGRIVDDEKVLQVQVNGRARVREVKVARAAEFYRKAFPSYRVVSWLIIHPSQRPEDLVLDNTGSTDMRMATMQQGLDEITRHLTNTTSGRVVSSAHDMTTMNRLHVA